MGSRKDQVPAQQGSHLEEFPTVEASSRCSQNARHTWFLAAELSDELPPILRHLDAAPLALDFP